ncbi:MAG TPA: RidA family protein [Gemmatimonadales bacterium]|jgi:2-iminobutanoate/2-iminopropanoate deaminase
MTSFRKLLAGSFTVWIVAASAGSAQAPVRQVVGTPSATLSPAVRFGDFVFVSGQLGVSRAAPDSTIQGQTTKALENVRGVLEKAGTTMENVTQCTVFLIDLKDFGGMNQAYAAAFPKDPPARSTVIAAALVSPAAKVEIECIAGMPR